MSINPNTPFFFSICTTHILLFLTLIVVDQFDHAGECSAGTDIKPSIIHLPYPVVFYTCVIRLRIMITYRQYIGSFVWKRVSTKFWNVYTHVHVDSANIFSIRLQMTTELWCMELFSMIKCRIDSGSSNTHQRPRGPGMFPLCSLATSAVCQILCGQHYTTSYKEYSSGIQRKFTFIV